MGSMYRIVRSAATGLVVAVDEVAYQRDIAWARGGGTATYRHDTATVHYGTRGSAIAKAARLRDEERREDRRCR